MKIGARIAPLNALQVKRMLEGRCARINKIVIMCNYYSDMLLYKTLRPISDECITREIGVVHE
jgi:hypothetical protein